MVEVLPDDETVSLDPRASIQPVASTAPGETPISVDRQLGLGKQQLQLMLSTVKTRVIGKDPFAPPKIGRFELIRQLGDGAMGIVYLARDPELDRKVALKCIHPSLFGSGALPRLRARMQREAKAMAKLAHANVVAIHEVGTHDEQLFMAMEFVDGMTLSAWLGEHERGWTEILDVFLAAGEGLEHAHAMGLVHRDFKPDNVLLSHDGIVKVSDFGLAGLRGSLSDCEITQPDDLTRSSDGHLTLTRTGALLGTPAYMSPEQLERRPVDARADQFSFCVALHEALFGVRPFSGQSYEELCASVLLGHRREPKSERGVPRWIRAVIDRGLSRRPEDRWPSMRALLDALRDDPKPRRRRRLVALAAGFVVLALAGAKLVELRNHAAGVEMCEAEARSWVARSPWTVASRAELETAIAAHDSPLLSARYRQVFASLDRRVDRLREVHREACVRGRVEHEIDHDVARGMHHCAGASAHHTKSTIAAVLEASAPAAWVLAAELDHQMDPSQCVEPRTAAERVAGRTLDPPKGAKQQVDTIVSAMAPIRALLVGGQTSRAEARAREMLAAAEALGWEPMIANARMLLGRALAEGGDPVAASVEFERAYFTAHRYELAVVVIRAASALAMLEDPDGAALDDRGVWLRHAEIALDDHPQIGPRERDAVEFARIAALRAEGDHASALDRLERMLDRARERDAELEVPELLRQIAAVELGAGQPAKARATLDEALAVSTAQFGRTGPDRWCLLSELAGALERLGEIDRARARHRDALAAVRELSGDDSPATAAILDAFASFEGRAGDIEAAAALYGESLELRARVQGPEHVQTARTRAALAEL